MKTKYSLSIPKPCHEDWSKMTPNEKGKFCQSCSKTVVDFTKMEVDEIQDYIHRNKDQRICGHIKQSQLNAINLRIPETVFKKTLSFHRLFLLALLLAMGTTLLNCSDNKGRKQKISNIEIVETNQKFVDTISKKCTIIEVKPDSIKSKIKPPVKPKIKDEEIIEGFIITGDIVEVEGALEITPHLNKQPYSYNFVDQKPKFLNTPANLSKDDESVYFQKEISNIINENFKVEQDNLGLKGKQRIYCQFEINENGVLENLEIRGPHPSFENEAKRVFKLFSKFIPARHNGENVSVEYTLPIVFVIED
ncbi:energy transducer TonB [Winogradskyella sp. PG-2]|uniref:energy transducer TonB n=1 Tax=Winogradskyella sp. PG-2 TaxID=754409 RepID=UPI0004588BF4|nr:energy transducer TonB [Winogradskyella sp. PG-2]BAO75240.1 hypothetical protein WPG_1010 [Winogradskyella sp. PG-2]